MASCGSVGIMVASTWGGLVRPVLRDGLCVVRRDDRHLQVGLDPPDRLVLADRPGLRDTLTHLERRPVGELREIVDRLVREGCLRLGNRCQATSGENNGRRMTDQG